MSLNPVGLNLGLIHLSLYLTYINKVILKLNDFIKIVLFVLHFSFRDLEFFVLVNAYKYFLIYPYIIKIILIIYDILSVQKSY